MGIRIHSAIVFGVRFTKKETKIYQRWLKETNTNEDEIILELVEKMFVEENKSDFSRFFNTGSYCKRNKKGLALKPYRPFWNTYNKKEKQKLIKNLSRKTKEYLKSIGIEDENELMHRPIDYNTFWFPYLDSECNPSCFLAKKQEDNHAREVDWALADYLNTKEENKVIELNGKRPWEIGTSKSKSGYYTFNGQNLLGINKSLSKDEKKLIYGKYFGTKKEYEEKKKELWYKYKTGSEIGGKPYLTYPYSGWYGDDYHFYDIDELYQLLCEVIPELEYDFFRLKKYLCFYWS